MCKPLQMVVYDPDAAAAAAAEQHEAKRGRPSADAGAVVPYVAAERAEVEPVDAVPLSAIAGLAPPAPVSREEPSFLRSYVLEALGLRKDLPVHFIHEKRVTDTDLNRQQNRFRIPTDGVLRRLCPILTVDELDCANLLKDPEPEPELEPEPEPESSASASASDKEGEQEPGKKNKKRKRQGKVHGGLPVRLVDRVAGVSGELLLSRWASSHGTIVKGTGYMDYIRHCSFKENDLVEIWAFKQRAVRLMGATLLHESPLYILIIKRDGAPAPQCSSAPV